MTALSDPKTQRNLWDKIQSTRGRTARLSNY
jgi:hypothetical protein